jgi:hypothetical protein
MVVTAREATEAHAKADGKVEYEDVRDWIYVPSLSSQSSIV